MIALEAIAPHTHSLTLITMQELRLQTGVPFAASDDVVGGWRLLNWSEGVGIVAPNDPQGQSTVSSTVTVSRNVPNGVLPQCICHSFLNRGI